MKKILVVDDDKGIRKTLEMHLSQEGYAVQIASNGNEALRKFTDADIMLLDLRMPEVDGMEVLAKVKEKRPSMPVIIITAYDDMETAIEAIRLGAVDLLGKPLQLDQLEEVLDKASELVDLSTDEVTLGDTPGGGYRPNVIVGRSRAVKNVFKAIGSVSDSEVPVLIQGESGTGKELVARAVHFSGKFKMRPFVTVTCSTLSPALLESELFGHEKGAFTGAIRTKPGKFELASGGTLFLDEIGEISPDVQVKLLRFLQEKEFERVGGVETLKSDVRVIAATNRDLEAMLEEGTFREDLYYRLRVVRIELPPLRERREDIPLLVEYFLDKIAVETSKPALAIPSGSMDDLVNYDWPGNVRELENVLRRAVVLSTGNVIHPNALELGSSEDAQKVPLLILSVQEVERSHIRNVLEFTGWHKSRAAEILNLSRPTLDKRIREYGLKQPGK
ncbi:MAG: sigma-54-dependent Fis family transcriptional regulator [Deltaproteobacteria bacterium]|nr:MAG: sigma-54-dependent Fis family transcriptional regulator [Deltaproteobacteria bacterium]